MCYRDPIVGRVQTVTRWHSVSNARHSTQGLPQRRSGPTHFVWFLGTTGAKRVPVRTGSPRSRPAPSRFSMTRDSDNPRSEARKR